MNDSLHLTVASGATPQHRHSLHLEPAGKVVRSLSIEQAGFGRAFAARNGADAERLTHTLRADLYITTLFFDDDQTGNYHEVGLERVEQIRRLNPNCKVLILSGLDRKHTRELVPAEYDVLYMPVHPRGFLDDVWMILHDYAPPPMARLRI